MFADGVALGTGYDKLSVMAKLAVTEHPPPGVTLSVTRTV